MTKQNRTLGSKRPTGESVSLQDEQKILLEIVETWRLNEFPEYRGFRCATCQQYKNEAWYHWINTGDENGNFRLSIHMCSDICEPALQNETIQVDSSKRKKVDRESFGNVHQFTDEAKKRFGEIVASWPDYKAPELKAFSCDECNNPLEINQADKERKGYHVWWKMPDGKTLTELHFHRDCGHNLGILTKEELAAKQKRFSP